jgi:hypothetical protein
LLPTGRQRLCLHSSDIPQFPPIEFYSASHNL